MQLGEMIDQAYELREQKREFERRIKKLNEKIDALSAEILERLDEMGTPGIKATKASATIAEQLVPNVTDWEAAQEWIRENEAEYLYHRRISSGAFKELLDQGIQVDGVEPFTKRSISLRVARGSK